MRGILMRPWKIAAITANPDKEWQTRRTIKPQPEHFHYTKDTQFPCFPDGEQMQPRYQTGEVVYLKETATIFDNGFDWTTKYNDNQEKIVYPPNDFISKHAIDGTYKYSARTMPAWAARYFIKILAVEACRTRDIAPEDCEAEGIIAASAQRPTIYAWPDSKGWYATPQAAYFALYDDINGKGAHERNFDWKYPLKLVSCLLLQR